MNIEAIQEPISVVASFSDGACRPVRFEWSGRTYEVRQINGRWVDRSGGGVRVHYSVQAEGQTYYIHFEPEQMYWRLDQVIVE